VSETKETEAGSEAQTESAAESEKPAAEGAETSEASASTDADEASAEGDAAPVKKKKKKAREDEPEPIKDRNARVRAEAAEKRRAKREREQGNAPRRNLDAGEIMDDALARSTHAAAGFITRNFNKVQWLIMAGLVGWIGYEVYSWRHNRDAEKATTALFKALSAETGKVGAADDATDERTGLTDTRRAFATDEERLKAAKNEYVLATGAVGSKASILTEFGAATAAYDLGQYKEAQAGFEKVKQHPRFGEDTDLKGRTLEGLGMSLEAQKNDEAALKAFKELSTLDSANFNALGLYHQARILKQQGKTEDALKLLDKAGEKLVSVKDNQAAIKYLRVSVMELYESLDPKKARELGNKLMPADMLKQMDGIGAGPGGGQQKLSQEQIQQLIEEMQKKQPPAQSAPADAPAPDAPPPMLAPIPDAPAPAPSGGQ
jgi:tetratricopeptide (TPR) repeat protein